MIDPELDGHVETSLGPYVLGALPEDECATVEEHLSRCAQCRQECQEFRQVTVLMAMLTDEDVRELTELAAPPSPW